MTALGNKLKNIISVSSPFVWAIIILYLSLTPSPPKPPGVLGWDKLQHAGAYGLLSLLLIQILLYWRFTLTRSLWSAGLVAVAYGALMELLQLLTRTGRSAEWQDVFADAVGVFLCCVIFRQVMKLSCFHNANPDKNNG